MVEVDEELHNMVVIEEMGRNDVNDDSDIVLIDEDEDDEQQKLVVTITEQIEVVNEVIEYLIIYLE